MTWSITRLSIFVAFHFRQQFQCKISFFPISTPQSSFLCNTRICTKTELSLSKSWVGGVGHVIPRSNYSFSSLAHLEVVQDELECGRWPGCRRRTVGQKHVPIVQRLPAYTYCRVPFGQLYNNRNSIRAVLLATVVCVWVQKGLGWGGKRVVNGLIERAVDGQGG